MALARSLALPRAVLLSMGLLMVSPTVLTLLTALKPASEASAPWTIPSALTFDNFVRVWGEGNFAGYFWNSFLISSVDALAMIVLASSAAYGLVFIRFPGKSIIRLAFLSGLMVPAAAIVLPLYSAMRRLDLVGTHLSVILADVALALPIFVFLFASYFVKIPGALHEAARIDGANEWQIYRLIVLPISMPVIITTGLLEFLWSWNDLLLRLLLLPSEQSRTLSVGLLFFQGLQSRDVTALSAGAVIMAVPVVVLFVLFQRHFVQGMTAGAVK